MRGFFFTSLYLILLLLSLYSLTSILRTLEIPPHPRNVTVDLVGNSGVRTFGYPVPCFVDLNTYGELNRLDLPVVRPC